MIVTSGPRRIRVDGDEPTAAYGAAEGAGRIRRYVELSVAAGGMLPRAALGGTFEPGPGALQVLAPGSGDPDPDPDVVPASTVSHLGKPLCPGLPDEFVPFVTAALTGGLGGGTVTVDRAGYDPVESSGRSFTMVAEALAAVLALDAQGGGPAGDDEVTVVLQRLAPG